MAKLGGDPEDVSTRPASRLWARLLRSPVVGGLLGMVCVVVLFYAEENWRGKNAWERCKRELAAQGAVVECVPRVPTVIPDNLNVFKAPRMAEWFLGQAPNDFTARLSKGGLSTNPRGSGDLLEVTVVSRTNQPTSLDSDLCLDYDEPLLEPADLTETETVPPGPSQVIPLIVMDEVPLQDAIRYLARQAEREYLLDSNVVWSLTQIRPSLPRQPFPWFLDRLAGRTPTRPPCVSIRWENVTAFQALRALLGNYNLMWIEDPTDHIGRISIRSESPSLVQLAPAVREQLKQALGQASSPLGPTAHTLKAALGFVLYHQDNPSAGMHPQPVHITVRSASVPSLKEVEAFFPRDTLPWLPASFGLRVLPSGTNTFSVFADPPFFCPVQDYLAQTDPCKPEFDLIREALKRPYARMDGDYARPISTPPRNFVGIRVVSQTLAQRAQSYLLLGQPDRALEELTLIHDLTAVVEAEPFSLVAAMIEVAVTGLYLDVIHDGFRLGAWREPQLVALQAQLEKIHLGPLLVAGLSTERVTICRTIETASAREFASVFDLGHAPLTFREKLKDPAFCILTFAPRGWRYHSMATIAYVRQSSIACFDRVTQTVRPGEIERAASASERIREHTSLTTKLDAIALPTFTRAWQAMAHHQSLADQAFIACALERYRLAHGEYPPDLASLEPAFADWIPHDIIGGGQFHYRRLNSTRFTLYSIGWNEKDEGGLAPDINSLADYAKADWVWN
jgi:hypothetical protein